MTREDDGVHIPRQIYQAMVAHARFAQPEEACGLLASDQQGRLRMVYCLTNAEHSASSFTIEPAEHFGALCHAEARGWTLAGAFHSHPSSAAYPSATDRRLAAEPDWLYVIVGLTDPALPSVRGFWLRDGKVREVSLEVGEEQAPDPRESLRNDRS